MSVERWKKVPTVDQGNTSDGWAINEIYTDKVSGRHAARYVGWVQNETDADTIIIAVNSLLQEELY